MKRLTGKARPYLPVLKWVLVVGLTANFLAGVYWWRRDEADDSAIIMMIWGGLTALLLDSLPWGRIVNMATRTIVVLCVGGLVLALYLDATNTKEPHAISLIAPLVAGIAYVARARPDPGR